MPLLTRKQRRVALVHEARLANTSTARVIDTHQSLLDFIELLAINRGAGAGVEVLSINLLGSPGFSASQLRNALKHMPNIQYLRLQLPLPIPIALLQDLRFPHLQHFNSNIPHTRLLPFLANHCDTITSLRVTVCGKTRSCPLESVPFTSLAELQCYSTCVRAFPYQHVDSLTVGALDPSASMCTILRSLSAPTSLHFMTLDIFPDDMNILQDVARVAPQVRTLRLIEKDHIRHRTDVAGGPGNSQAKAWHMALCELKCLEAFSFITPAALIPGEPGNEAQELSIVLQWTSGSMPGDTKTKLVHPTLNHITLLYGIHSRLTNCMSIWAKKDDVWNRTSFMSERT